MKSERRKLLAALGITGASAYLPTSWTKPVVESVILPAHAQTTPSAPGTQTISRLTFTYSDTVDESDSNDGLPAGVNDGDPVTISISFAASALENQSFGANDVLSFVWQVGSLTVTILDNGTTWSNTAGQFATDPTGTVSQVPSGWTDGPPTSASVSNGNTLTDWYINGGNAVLYSTPAWDIPLNNVASIVTPSAWTVTAS